MPLITFIRKKKSKTNKKRTEPAPINPNSSTITGKIESPTDSGKKPVFCIPFPNPAPVIRLFYLKLVKPRIVVFLDKRLRSQEDIRDFVTISILDNFNRIAEAANKYLKDLAKRKKKKAIIKGVLTLVLGIVLFVVAPAVILALYDSVYAVISARERIKAAKKLRDAAKLFKNTDAAFAAEIERVAAKLEELAAEEGVTPEMVADEKSAVARAKEAAALAQTQKKAALQAAAMKSGQYVEAGDGTIVKRTGMEEGMVRRTLAARPNRKPLESPLVDCPWLDDTSQVTGLGYVHVPGLDAGSLGQVPSGIEEEAAEVIRSMDEVRRAINQTVSKFSIGLLDRAKLLANVVNPAFQLAFATPGEIQVAKLGAAGALGGAAMRTISRIWFQSGKNAELKKVSPSQALRAESYLALLNNARKRALAAELKWGVPEAIALRFINDFWSEVYAGLVRIKEDIERPFGLPWGLILVGAGTLLLIAYAPRIR